MGVGTYLPTRTPPGRFAGTGFVLEGGRYVLTNAHVLPRTVDLGRNESLAILVGEGSSGKVHKVKTVGRDSDHDLAVLEFRGVHLPGLKLGNPDLVREGQQIAFTGFPIGVVLGLYPVTHTGIVSAISPVAIPQGKSRRLTPSLIKRLRDPFVVFQLDATAYPGNSGSPLYLPDTGEVIGIVNKVLVKETKENLLQRPSGITYAIPVSHARNLLRRIGVSPR